MCRTFLPDTESIPDKMHSVRPVPNTMQSYSSSMALKCSQIKGEVITCMGQVNNKLRAALQLVTILLMLTLSEVTTFRETGDVSAVVWLEVTKGEDI